MSSRSAISVVTARTVSPSLLSLGVAVFAAFIIVAQASGKQFGTIGDGDGGFLLLAVAHETERNLCAGLAAGDIGNQFIAVLDRLAIHGDDGIADFEARLLGGTSRRDCRNSDTAGTHAIDARDGGIFLSAKHDSDRAAGHAVVGANELVIDAARRCSKAWRIRRQRRHWYR